jgi:hypothetical protein
MTMTDDRLEILIGKYIYCQATEIERHLLEREMNQNPAVKELHERWRTLSESARDVVVNDIVAQGARPEDVFEQAWQRSKGFSWLRIVKPKGQVRFAVGLAAGFLLGVILHFTLVWTNGTTGEDLSRRGTVAIVAPTGEDRVAMNPAAAAAPRSVSRNVDWYGFTDESGNQWLIQQGVQEQRPQEGKVRLAAYNSL